MDPLMSIPQSAPGFQAIRDSRPATEMSGTASAKMVNISRSQSSDFTIVTAEGDTVTLSSSRSSELAFATYNPLGDSGSASRSAASFSTSRDFSFSVEGDLNKEELKDIRRAIKTVMKSARDVLRGDDEKAFRRASKLSNLDQIASLDANLHFRREISTTQVISRPPETDDRPEPALTETRPRYDVSDRRLAERPDSHRRPQFFVSDGFLAPRRAPETTTPVEIRDERAPGLNDGQQAEPVSTPPRSISGRLDHFRRFDHFRISNPLRFDFGLDRVEDGASLISSADARKGHHDGHERRTSVL